MLPASTGTLSPSREASLGLLPMTGPQTRLPQCVESGPIPAWGPYSSTHPPKTQARLPAGRRATSPHITAVRCRRHRISQQYCVSQVNAVCRHPLHLKTMR